MNDNSIVGNGEPQRFTVKRKQEPEWRIWVRERQLLILAAMLGLALLGVFSFVLFWPKAEVATPSTFVVHPGDSLIRTYGFDDGINVAERLRVPLRKREIGSDVLIPITYDEARALKSTTDRNLVTAMLFPGDRILTMRFPDGHVDMEDFVLFAPAPLAPQAAER